MVEGIGVMGCPVFHIFLQLHPADDGAVAGQTASTSTADEFLK